MDFFNDIGKKTCVVTSKIAKKTKLKLKVNEDKYKISDLYEEIGKKVYEKHIREEETVLIGEIEEECRKIDEIAEHIREARTEILSLKEKKQCNKCNFEMKSNDIYCAKCGEKQDEKEETNFEEALEMLEEAEVKQQNEEKVEHVKEKLTEKEE